MLKCSDIAKKLENIYPSEVTFMEESFTPLSTMLTSDETVHHMEFLCFSMQSIFCRRLEEIENGTKFRVDRWLKPNESGGGITCVIENGTIFERGGINVSVITAPLNEAIRRQMSTRGHDLSGYSSFKAVGISSVLHPTNPHTPTIHFNFRYFEMNSEDSRDSKIFWFGGGCDITPYLLHKDDFIFFHKSFKDACDKFDDSYYPKFKKWADDYFYLPHRGEHRGVGGIFFDDLTGDPNHLLKFVTECAITVPLAYIPIVNRTIKLPTTPEEIEWMYIRRGRYVEFNLIYDRGTKFGLSVEGSRIESILVSLPRLARWVYSHDPDPDSPPGLFMNYIRNPIDWVKAS